MEISMKKVPVVLIFTENITSGSPVTAETIALKFV